MPDVRYKVTSGRLNRQSKFRAVIAFVLVLICVALGGYVYCLRMIQRDSCLTKECLEAAANFLSTINTETDPCKDIYQYVCGNFNGKYTTSTDNQLLESRMKELLEKPVSYGGWTPLELQKQFYQTCVDTESTGGNEEDRISDIVKVLGGWPVVEGSSWRNFSIEEAYMKSWTMGLPVHFFFQLNTANESDSMEITFPSQIENLGDTFIENVYLTLMVETAAYFGGSRLIAEKDLAYALEFEKMLHKIIKNTDATENYVIINIEELDNILTQINMSKILNNSFVDNELFKVNIPFLSELNLMLAGVSSRTKANYYIWKTIQYFGPYLPAPLRSNFLNFNRLKDKLYNIYPHTGSRYDFCLRNSRLRFPQVLEISLTNSQSIKHKIQKIEEILTNIRYSYVTRITNSEWIDSQAKEWMKAKINSISNLFGYNDIKKEEFLSYYSDFENFNFTTTNIIDLIMDLNIFHRQQTEKLNVELDLSYVSYIEGSNSILIGASVLERLKEQRPNYLNYGALATELAHHIAHSLKLDAINREEDLNVLSEDSEDIFWANDTFHQLLSRVTCVMQQFSNETDNYVDFEDVIETIAIDVAYESYLEWVIQNEEEAKLPSLPYTPNQLFWLQYIWKYCNIQENGDKFEKYSESDGHFGDKIKLLNVLSNSLYFTNDFSCSENSTLSSENNKRKCYIF